MYQHRRAAGEGTSSAIYNHLQTSGHSFRDDNVEIICREHSWFERGVKEAIYVKSRNPSLNKHGGVRHLLSSAWDEILRDLGKPREREPRIRHCATSH